MNKLFFLLCITFSTSVILAQSDMNPTEAKAFKTYALRKGKVSSLLDTEPSELVPRNKRDRIKKYKKAPKNFIGRGYSAPMYPERAYKGKDSLIQSEDLFRDLKEVFNFDGLSSDIAPHDPSGCVGENHYVQVINVTEIGIYDLDGNLLKTYPANNLWSAINQQSAGDPCVLYDEVEKRWIISEFPNGNKIMIAVSKDENPLGGWAIYEFGTPVFPDYPKSAIWRDYLTITTNEEGPGVQHAYIIDKKHLYNDSTKVVMQRVTIPGVPRTETNFLVLTPVHQAGRNVAARNPMFLRLSDSSWGQVERDGIEIYTIDANLKNQDSTKFTKQFIATSPYDANPCRIMNGGFRCIPQKHADELNSGVDGLPEIIMHQSQYRKFDSHESIVLAFVTDVNGENYAGIRWMELRNDDNNGWKLYQEGTFTLDDKLHRFIPSIAIDAKGNIGLGYNVSSEDTYVGIRATGRLANDPKGEMTFNEVVVAEGLSTNQAKGRQGDYSHMAVSPTGNQFYFTAEYMSSENKAKTKIFSFVLQQADYDQRVIRLLSPQSKEGLDQEEVTVSVKNIGANALDTLDISYAINDGNFVREIVPITLQPDSTYTHTFATKAAMQNLGVYALTIVSRTRLDEVEKNDTFKTTINHIAEYDLRLTQAKTDSVTCMSDVNLTYTITNQGTKSGQPFTLLIDNGIQTDSIRFNGDLAYQESIDTTVTIALQSTSNTIDAVVVYDGIDDQVNSNNMTSCNIGRDPNTKNIDIKIQFDKYPAETSWVFKDSKGNQIDVSPKYTNSKYANKTVTNTYCLEEDSCYVLALKDVYGDGICCIEGNGNILIEKEGKAIAANNGQYGSGIEMQFCIRDACSLDIKTSTTPASGQDKKDGAILAEARGGVSPYTYSIDGFSTTQQESMFSDLSAGTYVIDVYDRDSVCVSKDTVTIGICDLVTMYDVSNASSSTAADGSIEMTLSTLDSLTGVTFNGKDVGLQKSQTFRELMAGDYIVEIKTKGGCMKSDTVTVSSPNSLQDAAVSEPSLIIKPNPTDGVIQVVLQTNELRDVFIPLYLYDQTGRLIKEFEMSKYNDTYVIPISLYSLPSGTYYIKVVNGGNAILRKAIRL